MFITPKEIENYCREHTSDEAEVYKELTKETYDTQNVPQMLSGKLSGAFMQLLVRMLNAKRVLEVGTFTGYTALKMAEAMDEDGKVYTLELRGETAEFAKKHFAKAPWGNKITLIEGPALESLERIEGPLDLTFIDADKVNYPNYYEKALSLTRSGGIIAVDNALWSGDVLNPQDPSTEKIHETNQKIQTDSRVRNILVPIRDGVMLAQKI